MIYQFDSLTLDSGTRQLLRAGEEVHLSPKAFELLLLLIENRSQAMSKADLNESLWPATYVSETNLAGLIAELRRAMGDSAEDPRYIRTMHRFGYWFIGQVRQEPASSESVAPAVRHWIVWETRQIPLADGDNIVGRGQDAGVWIEAPGVSRHHARIRVGREGATIEDLDSKNGTFLRDVRISGPSALADGDQIRIGSVVVVFRTPPPADLTETAQI